MATKEEIAALMKRIIDSGLKGKLTETFIEDAAEAWGSEPADVLEAARKRWVREERFLPTIAEFNTMIAREKLARQVTAELNFTEGEIRALELDVEQHKLLDRQPKCEGKCDGTGWVTNDEQEISVMEFYRRGGTNGRQQEWKPCPDGCLHGHQPPAEHEVAQLRARIFNQPQPTTSRRKVSTK